MTRAAALFLIACAAEEPAALPLVINPTVDVGLLLAGSPGQVPITFSASRDTVVGDAQIDDDTWTVLTPFDDPVPMGRSDTINVVLGTPASEPGTYTAGLIVVGEDGALLGETRVTFTAEPPEGSMSPLTIDLGPVAVGASATASLLATNDNRFAWEIVPEPTDARLSAPDAPFRLEPGTEGQVTIELTAAPPLGKATFRVPCMVGTYQLAEIEITADITSAP